MGGCFSFYQGVRTLLASGSGHERFDIAFGVLGVSFCLMGHRWRGRRCRAAGTGAATGAAWCGAPSRHRSRRCAQCSRKTPPPSSGVGHCHVTDPAFHPFGGRPGHVCEREPEGCLTGLGEVRVLDMTARFTPVKASLPALMLAGAHRRRLVDRFMRGGARTLHGRRAAQTAANGSVHALWLPPRLRVTPTAIMATAIRSQSSSPARRNPRRWYSRRACRVTVPRRGCRLRRERRAAHREPAWTFSRTGIASPAASRVNVASSATSLGSERESLSLIASRACCSRALRLITAPPIGLPCIWSVEAARKRPAMPDCDYLARRPSCYVAGARAGAWSPSYPAQDQLSGAAPPRAQQRAAGSARGPRPAQRPPPVYSVYDGGTGRGHQPG